MFAHQVVDDLVKLSKQSYGNSTSTLMKLSSLVRKSQQFHLGKVEGLIEMTKRNLGKPLFMGDTSDVRLPYALSWFDWPWKDEGVDDPNHRSTKRACLAIESEDGKVMLVFLFAFMCSLGYWLPCPLAFRISVGSNYGMTNANIIGVELFDKNKMDSAAVKGLKEESTPDLEILNQALLLLSCRNIATEKKVPPEALNRKRKKAGKQPLFTYHTLVLKPVGSKQKSIPKHLWNDRIHLQRGHFKTYTEEKPLFGRLTGRYWWQAHVRGNNKDGVVMKDYLVGPAHIDPDDNKEEEVNEDGEE